jgi:hypothetical protein
MIALQALLLLALRRCVRAGRGDARIRRGASHTTQMALNASELRNKKFCR